MAVRKQHFDNSDDEQTNRPEKRSRLTVDISEGLRRRVKWAALQNDLSISEYVGQILEQSVPEDSNVAQQELHPVTPEFLEQVYQIREKIIQESKGELFEDSAEAIRRAREERTRELMGEL